MSGKKESPVSAHNEWDLLEEVIVGVLDGQANRPWENALYGPYKPEVRDKMREECNRVAGTARAADSEAYKELDNFVRILEAEGVKVRRPEVRDNTRSYATPQWASSTGTGQTCPRDILVVIGEEIIEAPMSFRSRFFEYLSYRPLIREYFKDGAKWTAAPKPEMANELYSEYYGTPYETGNWQITEYEPVFDAAEIMRAGTDIFIQRSHSANASGVEWLRRHLGETYRVHEIETDDPKAMHVDANFVLMAPGKAMVNPERPLRASDAEFFKKAGWDLLECPPTIDPKRDKYKWGEYDWLHMNVLMLDEQRVFVEEREEPFIKALRDWGFKPIAIPFRHCFQNGGGFHCFTCDVRRRGELKSYF